MFKCIRRSSALALTIALCIATSCVDSNELLGNGFVPPSQEQNTFVDRSLKVKTSTIALDSIQSDNSVSVLLGSIQSKLFGRTNAAGVGTFFPYTESFADPTKLFGKNPTLDSMLLSLYFVGSEGDTSYNMQISVHEVKNLPLRPDETYYSNFDMTGYYDPTPLVEFDLSGGDAVVDLWLPSSFYSKLLLNDPDDSSNPYFIDTVFTDTFNGFYFKCNNEPSLNQRGIIRQLALSGSMMELYYHNEADGDIEADTTYLEFYFTGSPEVGNRFTTISHDYTTADPSVGGVDLSDINNPNQATSRVLLQGLGGVGAQVEIDTMLIDELRQGALDQGYSSVAVHKATLEWTLMPQLTTESEISLEQINIAAEQIGLYYDFQELDFLKEYTPLLEESAAEAGSSYTSDLGGLLNRSTLTYQQDITSKVQYLLSKPDGEQYSSNGNYRPTVEMLPSWSERLHYNETVVGGSESLEYAPKITVIYTLIK